MKSTTWINSKTFSVVAILALAQAALALDITVRLPAAAEVEAWVLPKVPDQMPTTGRRFNSAQFPVSVSKDLENGVIVVSDDSKNAVAITSIAALEGAVWQIKPKDWRIARLDVNVYSRGAIMPSGTVDAQSGAYRQTQTIENGKVQFFAVPAGAVQYVVHYKSGGIDKKTSPEERNVKLISPQESVALTVIDNVDGGADAAKPEQKKEQGGSPIVNLLLLAAGMGIVLGGLYIVLRYLTANQEKTQLVMKKLGVDPVAPPPADDEPVQAAAVMQPLVPEGHCEFCGKPLAECICNKTATAPIHVASPHLMGGALNFDLSSGGVIGREGDFVVDDATVSRRHAEIRVENGLTVIKDLGSSNGTFVNGTRIDTETTLNSGDDVQFGAVKLRYQA